MSRRYNFLHTCGHVGIGPILRIHAHQRDVRNLSMSTGADLDTLQLRLLIPCPFCSDIEGRWSVKPGSGVLAVLKTPELRPFEVEWQILRVCVPEEINSHDWAAVNGKWEISRQMAWIPKPCGRVFASTRAEPGFGARGQETLTEVDCTWTQSLDTPVKSRLPGMLSELSAALSSG